jgi:hypothetical protein
MKQITKEEVQNQLQSILNQYKQNPNQSHIQTQMSRNESELNLGEIPTIEMKMYSFDVLGSKLYVVTQSDHLPYIQEYIDSINAGNPDKDGVIIKYAMEYQKMSESLIDRLLNQVGKSSVSQLPVRIISELNKIELDLKPLLDAQKRDQKITDLLDGGLPENGK